MKKIFALFLLSLFLKPELSLAKEIVVPKLEIAGIYNNLDYNNLSKNLKTLEKLIKDEELSQQTLSEKITELGNIHDSLENYKIDLDASLKTVSKRIEILGPAPEKGGKEDALVVRARQEFSKELIGIKGKIATIDILIAKVDEIDALILNLRNKELLKDLLNRQKPLIYPSKFLQSGTLFLDFLIDIIISPFEWYDDISAEKQENIKEGFAPTLLLIILSLWLSVYIRMFIMKHFGYRKDIDNPRYSKKAIAAVFVAIAYGVIPAVIVGSFLLVNITQNIVTSGFFGLVLNSILFYSLFIILAKTIARVVFAPYHEKWRLINFSTEKAKKVTSSLYFTITILGIMGFLANVVNEANYPLELITFISAMGSAIKAFCIILISKRLLWEEVSEQEELAYDEDDYQEKEEEPVSLSFKITLALGVFALATFLLSIFGYPSLATFILDKFIVSCLIVFGFLIARRATKEIIHRALLLTVWSKTFRFRRRVIQKIDFWLFLVIEPVIVLGCLFILLNVWGVSTKVLITLLQKVFFGFMVGGIKLSLISIILGLVIFFISISLVKIMKKKLMTNILSKMEIEDGIKYSLASGFGFVGFIVSLLLAIVVMGGSLTSIALVAGALSFGIGLGLQNIVNNFVSGIVLLFERPVKIGDWVIINGQEGIVKQVSIRATELETWEKSNIIIPNADILSNSLVNLTHTDKIGRVDISVGVAYGSDTKRVKEILEEVAENHKKILKKPAAMVIFKDFGDSSLNFELRAFTSDVMNRLATSSELRFEIDEMFRKNKIEIPFPQRTLHFAAPAKQSSIAPAKKTVKKVEKNARNTKKAKKST